MRHNKETNFEKERHFAIQDRHLAIQDMNKTRKTFKLWEFSILFQS